jgi:hypothetical protein
MDFDLAEAISPFHTAAGAAFNTFTTKKDVSPQPLPVLRPDKLRKGSKLYIKAAGEYTDTATVNLTMGFWFGTRTGTITGDIALSSVISLTSSAVAWPWWMEWEGICLTTGATGTLLGQGQLQLGSALTTFSAEVPIPITAALRTVSSFDTTIERAFGVSATWGTSAAGNSIAVNNLRVMVQNGFSP